MPLLVTGGTGFLGAYLARYAAQTGGEEQVFVLDQYPAPGRVADILDRITIVEGDVADAGLVDRIVERLGIDRIAHFAFILGSPLPGRMVDYARVQLLGTANVFEAARNHGVCRVLFASSVAAYGRQRAEVLSEDLVPDPSEPYGAAKVWCETTARHYCDKLGLDTVTIRYGSTYGLGRAARGSYASGMLNAPRQLHYMARVEDAARGKPVTMPRGDALADFSYAADAAKAGWLALTAEHLPHRLYNAPSTRRPIGEFTAAMRKLLPHADIAEDASERPGNAHAPMDCSRLVEDLGFAPDHSLEAGIADYITRIRMMDHFDSKELAQ